MNGARTVARQGTLEDKVDVRGWSISMNRSPLTMAFGGVAAGTREQQRPKRTQGDGATPGRRGYSQRQRGEWTQGALGRER